MSENHERIIEHKYTPYRKFYIKTKRNRSWNKALFLFIIIQHWKKFPDHHLSVEKKIWNPNFQKNKIVATGHVFYSDTNTEVITYLFEALLVSHNTLKTAFVNIVNQLKGAYAVIIILSRVSRSNDRSA